MKRLMAFGAGVVVLAIADAVCAAGERIDLATTSKLVASGASQSQLAVANIGNVLIFSLLAIFFLGVAAYIFTS